MNSNAHAEAVAALINTAIAFFEVEGFGLSKGAGARDKAGRSVACKSPHARSLCLLGALSRAWDGIDYTVIGAADRCVFAALPQCTTDYPAGYNDRPETTKDDIVIVLRNALTKIEGEL